MPQHARHPDGGLGLDGSVAFTPDGRPTDEAELSSGTCSRLRAFLSGEIAGLDCLASGATCSKAVEDAAVAVEITLA